MALRLINNAARCNGHLSCCAVAPDLLQMEEHADREWTVAIRGMAIDVPPELRAQAQAAVRRCPEEAYTLIEEPE